MFCLALGANKKHRRYWGGGCRRWRKAWHIWDKSHFSHILLYIIFYFFLSPRSWFSRRLLFFTNRKKQRAARESWYGSHARLDTFGVRFHSFFPILFFFRMFLFLLITFILYFSAVIVWSDHTSKNSREVKSGPVVTARLDTFGVRFHSFLPFYLFSLRRPRFFITTFFVFLSSFYLLVNNQEIKRG